MIAKVFGMAAAAALLTGLAASGADALPLAPTLAGASGAPGVTLVAGGCGLFGHRGPYGGCRPGGRIGGVYLGPGPVVTHRCFIRPTVFGPRRVCR